MSLVSFLDQIMMMSKNAYSARRGRRMHKDSPQFWQKFPETVLEEAPCAFVLSTGRCGTQLLTRVLRRCGNVDVNHHAELASELQFPSKVAFESATSDGPGFELAALCSRFEPVQTSFLNNRIFVETNNRITFLAPYLKKVFKKACFLHLVRNPSGFVRSGVNAGFYAGGYYDTGRITPSTDSIKSEWDEYTQVKKVAWLWNETNQFIEDFKTDIAPERFLTIRSEDLFRQTEVVEQVVDFLGGRPLTEIAIQRLTARKVNAGSSGGLPSKYEDWPQQEQKDLRQTCLLAEEYGYPLKLPGKQQGACTEMRPTIMQPPIFNSPVSDTRKNLSA